MIIQEIVPRSGIEWLWVADLVELSWDIVRYRSLRQKMLEVRRQLDERRRHTPDGGN